MGIFQRRTGTGAALLRLRSSRLWKTCLPLPTTLSLRASQRRSATRYSSILMLAFNWFISPPQLSYKGSWGFSWIKYNEYVNSAPNALKQTPFLEPTQKCLHCKHGGGNWTEFQVSPLSFKSQEETERERLRFIFQSEQNKFSRSLLEALWL